MSDNTRTHNTTQNHGGEGDNIRGDKIVCQAIKPEVISKSLHKILKQLRHRDFTTAKENLSTQKTNANLNADSVGALDVVATLADLAEGLNTHQDEYQNINEYLSTVDNSLCRDIAVSAQIRIDSNGNRVDAANLRYKALAKPGIYTNEAFYECIAKTEEIKSAFEHQKANPDETALCGLVRGAMRLGEANIIMDVAEFLKNNFPNKNSSILHLLSCAVSLHHRIDNRHYWCITSTLHEDVITLADETIKLLLENKGEDNRVVNQAIVLMDYVDGSYQPLMDACWSMISPIEELFPNHAARIRYFREGRTEKLQGVFKKIADAHKYPAIKEETVSEIISRKEISAEDSIFLANAGDTKSIRQWVANGGDILQENGLEKAFSILELRTLACTDDPQSIDSLRDHCAEFIKNFILQVTKLNPRLLLNLSEKLCDLGLSDYVSTLIKPFLPPSNPWPSPIVRSYIGALLSAEQFMTLNSVLTDIHQDNWDEYLWQVRARQFEALEKYAEAIEATQQTLQLNNNNIYNWYFLIGLFKKSGFDQSTINMAISKIPESAFIKPCDMGYALLHEMAINGGFSRAEVISIQWFIDAPLSQAVSFSNFYLGLIVNQNLSFSFADTVGKCIAGVEYLKDGKTNLKILTENNVNNSSFININSPLGELLLRLPVNEISHQGMAEITLIKRVPPFMAAAGISHSIRESANDGSDCFYSYEAPEAPDEMLVSLKRKLLAIEYKSTDIDANPNMPLFMKGYHQYKLCPVKGALKHLTDKNSIVHALPDFGEENPQQIILDAYSIIYLALTGLIPALNLTSTDIVITPDTRRFLNSWLDDVNREDYLTLDVHPDRGIWRTNAKEIREQTLEIQVGINIILDNAIFESPNLVDLPPDVTRIQDMIDTSVSSSLKLSITNDIPWFCLDQAFAYLYKESLVKTINVQKLIMSLAASTDFELKKQGIYRHLFTLLPYPLTYSEIAQLGMSTEVVARFCLIAVFEQYPKLFQDTQFSLRFLTLVLQNVFISLLSERPLASALYKNGPQDKKGIDRLFNTCCRVAIRISSNESAEFKLAILLHELLREFYYFSDLQMLIKRMAIRFIDGHFLNLDEINKNLTAFSER